ncbi:class I SAM-dependent methyltransferase [Kribbella turkmenica]|uniref:Class I SAM-dependent methyltransferase n=1 Tax=Kribbella turkmenica TaxID=2530375 RepID=A0A4R4X7A3_9ACTN|nr:class I SAM-dependent methyltransferase [Kribbella turkmenica]TDD26284.1 class I SAM-dependent methyltransferase [Kribbella turkmenica]
MRVGQGGDGPGPHTPDGSAVELYELAPVTGEDELINAAIEPASRILELGCGTGRITRPLLALGHHVVAVDESAEMVARVPGTETIRSTIGDLRLDRRFDLVLMMSFLVNVADEAERLRLLRTCAHHVRPGGTVLLQQQLPGMLHAPTVREKGNRRFVVSDVEQRPGNIQAATLTHTVDGRTWSQRILTQNLTEEQLASQLTQVGLTLADYLTPDRTWVRARTA